MQIKFYKYQGTGNDFILLDNREGQYSFISNSQVAQLCNRRFGIGADGLMLIENTTDADFKMVYYNSDGNESSMCGNGGRCITAFANYLGIFIGNTTFIAIDGLHEAKIHGDIVELKMIDVLRIENYNDDYVLNTGSPHYIKFLDDVNAIDVFAEGRKIRNSERFKTNGINVNFVQITHDGIKVRTYERGVEDETFSCGTGVVAASIISSLVKLNDNPCINVSTLGGHLEVKITKISNQHYTNIWLKGKAQKVFEGIAEF
jgi:diaminopimelate epimerase